MRNPPKMAHSGSEIHKGNKIVYKSLCGVNMVTCIVHNDNLKIATN
jgi:hypothetical protein